MKLDIFKTAGCAIYCLLASAQVQATHLRSADIKVERVCEEALTFKITVIAYLNTGSNTRFGTNSEVLFGDGGFVKIPIMNSVPRPDLGNNIAVATFSTVHSYASHGAYTITYLERDRSFGVLNIENSDDVPYVTFVAINTSGVFGCNHYPVLSVPPIDRACLGVTFYHAAGAYDIDGDSLSYALGVPASGPTALAAYTAPNAVRFYANHNTGNEAKTGQPSFMINSLTGLVTWDAPGMVGEYNIAFKITEWRKDTVSGFYNKLSTTTRDMQIIVEECQNVRPNLMVPIDTCVVAGTLINKLIQGVDADNHPVKIEVFSETLDMNVNPATYSPTPTVFTPSDPPTEVNFQWHTECGHVRQQPYQVVFKITDNPPKGPKLVNFKIWNVRVVAPAPVWKELALNLVNRHAILEWEEYSCEQALKMQVWRKVGSYTDAAGYCDTRPPSYWGYRLIAELPLSQTSFIDTNYGKGLSVGARYCYRLAALIGDTRSYTSDERCVGPIQADAPVITHVSVESTLTEGDIRISWRKPFNINKEQFPEPYEYEVYRAGGFIGDSSLQKVGRVRDTTLLDSKVNTVERIFNYRIVLYATPFQGTGFVPIDTSATASTVRLRARAGKNRIELTWRDSVAWSNVAEGRPYHLIYRATGSSSVKQMVLVDSVDVTLNGFIYLDDGRYRDLPIEDDKMYSYRVLTRGTYGNPQIALQENFSQSVSLHPENDLLPCKPTLTVVVLDCDRYVASNTCDEQQFTNTIYWYASDFQGCRKDIKAFNVYGAMSREGSYEILASNTIDTFFIDTGLRSYARCYRVSAIDRLGQEGPLSDSVCNDNCPYYRIPNVFTPNGDGFNDTFNTRFQTGLDNTIPCPRFVKSVDFRVFNRWGKEVFHNDPDEATSVRIEWSGKDRGGTDLDAGVYYYSADVSFEMLDAANQKRTYKGWIQLLK